MISNQEKIKTKTSKLINLNFNLLRRLTLTIYQLVHISAFLLTRIKIQNCNAFQVYNCPFSDALINM